MRNSLKYLDYISYQLKRLSLIQTGIAQSGHPTSCLSAADICTALFFEVMHFDPDNYHELNNDRFILSKGHASALLYAIWHILGKISYEELIQYRSFDSPLEGHPTFRFAYTEAATGSLGIGLSIGVGEAWIAKRESRNFHTYILLGDGEMSEGSNWEAIMRAGELKLSNITAIIDCNQLSQSETSLFERSSYSTLKQGFESFGWHIIEVNGHNIEALINALNNKEISGPKAILAYTEKGHGIPSIANHQGYHGKVFSANLLAEKLDELEKNNPSATDTKLVKSIWQPSLPQQMPKLTLAKNDNNLYEKALQELYQQILQPIATRKAAGIALAIIGSGDKSIACLDADVKNSTYTELFETYFPERFFQCFIAEQNMISIALGLERQGKKPFAATFASFLTRAHDQIRMAAIGNSKIKIIGSHAGVSIGQDGPSQMGLEDIALFAGLPNSIILYPSDGISTYKLFSILNQYQGGIGYMRTTRAETPSLYTKTDSFNLGGSYVLRSSENDQICIVTAGITIFEALKAYEKLINEGISVAVIDAYCLKPIDIRTIIKIAKLSKNKILTIEDHYEAGGIGQLIGVQCSQLNISVYSLFVPSIPRSGSPEKLLSWAKIDYVSIVEKVKEIITKF